MKRKKLNESPIEWLQRCLDSNLSHEQKRMFDGLFQQANYMLAAQRIIERQLLVALIDDLKEKHGIHVDINHKPYRKGDFNFYLGFPKIKQ